MMPVLHLGSSLQSGNQEVIFWLAFGYVLYFIPFTLAVVRSSRAQWQVLWLNLFGGWTVIGWLAALRLAVRS